MSLPALANEALPEQIAQARAAYEKTPNALAPSTTLTQALLDAGEAVAAYDIAKRTYALHPHALTAMEKLALAAMATQRWQIAYSVLLQVEKTLNASARPLPATVVALLAELAPRWWLARHKGGVVLRRPEVTDTAFIAATFANQRFMQHYHRFQKSDATSIKHFITTAQRAPQATHRLDWIIGDRTGKPLGLAAIVDIDWPNQRGELLIGMTGTCPPAYPALATAAVIEYAFTALNLAKLISYVYADNPAAQANTRHLGFVQEGLLREHITHHHGRSDLFINGMTRTDFNSNRLLQKLNRRWPTTVHSAQPATPD